MARLFLLVVLGFVAAYYFPDSRQAMENAAEPLITPIVKWSTLGEMAQVGGNVVEHEAFSGKIPDRRDWSGWLDWRGRVVPTSLVTPSDLTGLAPYAFELFWNRILVLSVSLLLLMLAVHLYPRTDAPSATLPFLNTSTSLLSCWSFGCPDAPAAASTVTNAMCLRRLP